jgi:predicted phage tail protein
VTQTFISGMMPKIERARVQQMVFRWGVTILCIVLAALGYWQWAWLALALAVLGVLVDVGMALVVGQVAQMAATMNPRHETPVGSRTWPGKTP